MTKIRDAAECGREDANAYLAETDESPDEIRLLAARMRRVQQLPDEGLINAMGRGWVLDAAGAPDNSDESWSEYGLPWCERYNDAYLATLES